MGGGSAGSPIYHLRFMRTPLYVHQQKGAARCRGGAIRYFFIVACKPRKGRGTNLHIYPSLAWDYQMARRCCQDNNLGI